MMGWAMRRFPPGSFGWLLFHEIRMGIRQRARNSRTRVIGYILLAAFVVFGVMIGYGLRNTPIPVSSAMVVGALTAVILSLSFMTTQAMLGAQRTLYESGDLDLLLSAPVPTRSVLLAKLCGIAGTIVLSFAALTLPFAIPIALFNHPGMFGVVAVLVSCALLAACVGLGLTLVLARIAGPRAARTVGQITAGLLGGAVFLVSQILNTSDHRESRVAVIFHRLANSGVTQSWWGGLPGRAAFGDPVAILVMLGSAVAIFVVTGILFQRWFVSGVQDAGQHLSRSKASKRGIERHFRPSLFGTVFRKEMQLLVRDPQIAFQVVLRLVYLGPLLFIGLRSSQHIPIGPSLAFISVAIAGQLVGSFTWLAVQAEDTPDLITVAPVEKSAIDRTKLLSAMALAAPIAVILPIAIVTQSVLGALVTILFTALGGGAAGFIELKLGKPTERKRLNRRQHGSIVTRLVTLLVTGILGLITGGIVYFLP
ncbi:putative ABC exporter domain-containing protein [Stakelama marina]|uniref:ABC-2 type transport system permease protein n=1 Tax=Stakelama marina TaxID=2826939 RepID=A0A8T4IIZ0_9SPHN|nr:putative ABC exporter domain-containing protein [Stakelama marina]MBR0552279.1 hypothetical protein [Stakelama marina]